MNIRTHHSRALSDEVADTDTVTSVHGRLTGLSDVLTQRYGDDVGGRQRLRRRAGRCLLAGFECGNVPVSSEKLHVSWRLSDSG